MNDQKRPGLGSYLRDEREKRGLSIEQVASATKINIKLLHALEDDQYSQLPALPFLKGFIASYCKILNLSADQLLVEYQEYLQVRSQERPNKDTGHKGYAFEDPSKEKNRWVLWGTLAGFILVGGITLYFLKPRIKLNQNPKLEEIKKEEPVAALPVAPTETSPAPATPPPAATPVAAQPTTPAPTPTPAPVTPPPAAPAKVAAAPSLPPEPPSTAKTDTENDPLNTGRNLKPEEVKTKVLMKAKESVTIRYQVDHLKPMQFVLKKDLMIAFKAKERVLLQTANSTNLLVKSGNEYVPIETTKNSVKHGSGTTWGYPRQVLEKIGEPFNGFSALP